MVSRETVARQIDESERRSLRIYTDILDEDPEEVPRAVELWLSGFKEKNVLAYAMNDLLTKYDMETEEGVQMYVATVSLISIFSLDWREVDGFRRGGQRRDA